jgi:hypothetical protein
MPGKILLISRKTIQEREAELKPFLGVVPIQMAVAVSPEDADAAKKLTEAVATFNHTTAIVADFMGDLIINEDGSVEPLPLVSAAEPEPALITGV